jgi:ABC transporter substrate binding protein
MINSGDGMGPRPTVQPARPTCCANCMTRSASYGSPMPCSAFSSTAMRTTTLTGYRRSRLDLVRRQVAVIACNGDAGAAAKSVTATIPIVFATGEDPVRQGLVTNLGRPDSNLTGVTFFSGGVLGEKRMELLHDLVPKAALVAVLADPNYGGAEADLQGAEAAGRVAHDLFESRIRHGRRPDQLFGQRRGCLSAGGCLYRAPLLRTFGAGYLDTDGCCAHAAIGHADAAPPSSVMNSRRLIFARRVDQHVANLGVLCQELNRHR